MNGSEAITILAQCKAGDFNSVERWLRDNPAGVNIPDGDGWSVLHYLARAEAHRTLPPDAIESLGISLLQAGADPHQENSQGDTPFNVAAPASPIIGRLMTNHWLDQALQGKGRGLNEASGSHRSTLAQYMAKWSSDEEIEGQLDRAIKAGMRIAVPNDSGWTPLHAAAAMGRVKAVAAFYSRYSDAAKTLRTTAPYQAPYGVGFPAGATAAEIARARLNQDCGASSPLRGQLKQCLSAMASSERGPAR